MRVCVYVGVYGANSWEPLAEQDVEVQVTPEAAAIMPWEIVCANLVQSALDKAESKLNEEDTDDD